MKEGSGLKDQCAAAHVQRTPTLRPPSYDFSSWHISSSEISVLLHRSSYYGSVRSSFLPRTMLKQKNHVTQSYTKL